jgi:uncharacterized protein
LTLTGSVLSSVKILNLGSVTRIIAVVNIISLLSLFLLLFVHFLPNNHIFPFHYAYAQQYTGATSSSNSNFPILNASSNSSGSGSNILSTSGMATADVKPDKVTIIVGVETTNKTAKAALSSNAAALNKVLEVLLAAGVKKNETSTSSFSVSPNYNYSQGQNKITGFTVANSIQIQSSNVNGTAKWIDTAVSSGGANTIDSINFALSDNRSGEVKNNLIKQAVIDARSKADIAASALGLKIIGVKSVNLNELEQEPPAPQPLAMTAAIQARTANATPIIAGQQKISVNISISWLIG